MMILGRQLDLIEICESKKKREQYINVLNGLLSNPKKYMDDPSKVDYYTFKGPHKNINSLYPEIRLSVGNIFFKLSKTEQVNIKSILYSLFFFSGLGDILNIDLCRDLKIALKIIHQKKKKGSTICMFSWK